MNNKILKIYGISQNPDTKDYIMILQNEYYCENCVEKYTNYNWCKPCQINYLKINFTNWTSENEKIDDFIQEMQLKYSDPSHFLFEWIPYNQFDNLKEKGKDDFATVYSAVWKNGPLYYDYSSDRKYLRKPADKKVTLKCLHNSRNITDEFLNKV